MKKYVLLLSGLSFLAVCIIGTSALFGVEYDFLKNSFLKSTNLTSHQWMSNFGLIILVSLSGVIMKDFIKRSVALFKKKSFKGGTVPIAIHVLTFTYLVILVFTQTNEDTYKDFVFWVVPVVILFVDVLDFFESITKNI